ncbi:MAG: response regulator transcription factor [Elusimicrobia bacterium]|nr:response regulator transcription factor [Elusimicrobiota bacterium]
MSRQMTNDQATILLVEDDPGVRVPMREALSNAGYLVAEADRIDVARHLLRSAKPALAVLDVELPDGSGIDLCKEIRANKSLGPLPVIMLTGKGAMGDKGEGFAAGADQYLVKPVPPREVLMWVGALVRRLKLDAGESDVIEAGDLSIDLKSHLVKFKGQVLSDLTVKEFELLFFLVRARPQVLTRKYILSNLWKTVAVDNVVDTHIHNLRKKVGPDLALRLQSVPGKGFRYLG